MTVSAVPPLKRPRDSAALGEIDRMLTDSDSDDCRDDGLADV